MHINEHYITSWSLHGQSMISFLHSPRTLSPSTPDSAFVFHLCPLIYWSSQNMLGHGTIALYFPPNKSPILALSLLSPMLISPII